MRALARTADKLAREHVLKRDHHRCRSCDREDRPLEWAHILGRAAAPHLRWDPDNAVTLCNGDHWYFTANPARWRRFIAEQFGADHYDNLKFRQARADRNGDQVDVAAVIRGFREYELTEDEMKLYRSGAWLG